MQKYFMGDAFDNALNTEIEILIVAEDEDEAKTHYLECIGRHKELEKLKEPKIAEFWGDWDLINISNTEARKQELEKYLSVPIYI